MGQHNVATAAAALNQVASTTTRAQGRPHRSAPELPAGFRRARSFGLVVSHSYSGIRRFVCNVTTGKKGPSGIRAHADAGPTASWWMQISSSSFARAGIWRWREGFGCDRRCMGVPKTGQQLHCTLDRPAGTLRASGAARRKRLSSTGSTVRLNFGRTKDRLVCNLL
jgi:hypothetical protein